MPWHGSHYVAAGALAAGALGWGWGWGWATHDAWPGRRPLIARPIRVDHAYVEYADTLRRAETPSDVLRRGGIVGRDRAALLAVATDLPVRRLRPGLVFRLRRLQTDSVADRVMVRLSPERRLQLARGEGEAGWRQTTEVIPWTVTRLRVTGIIETSLYDALDKAMPDSFLPPAERRALAWAIADVYDWEVDFTRDVRPGNRFRVLVERLESADGDRRFGRILAAEVDVARVPDFAFYFTPDSTQPGAFYDQQGRSLKRAFLRAPLQFRRVSSRFGARFHPVLHRWRAHEGIDFSAPYGTPVRATADGSVTQVGREDAGYGNLIELRHANGIRTRYGHLSAFARGLHVGERVEQGETIGYVGSTGLSTGPHLHYEFLVNGRPSDPQRKDMGAGTPVSKDLRVAYNSVRARLLAELAPAAASALPFSAASAAPHTAPTVAARDD
jgi:murein DD-endopeptidase MepM/ murein hydrolase activator NlpD